MASVPEEVGEEVGVAGVTLAPGGGVARSAGLVAGRATLGWLQLDDDWKAKRESPRHGAVAWPDSLDHFYLKEPFAGTAALFGYSIEEPTKLAEHVRRVIEAGIREDARLNQGRNRHAGGPVDDDPQIMANVKEHFGTDR